jgi:uncharacterized membrane protein
LLYVAYLKFVPVDEFPKRAEGRGQLVGSLYLQHVHSLPVIIKPHQLRCGAAYVYAENYFHFVLPPGNFADDYITIFFCQERKDLIYSARSIIFQTGEIHLQTASFNTRRLVGLAILIAIVVVLQFVVGSVSIGSFSITLSLVPIVVGAAVYGAAAGGILGLALGAVVLINTINGTDVGANMMWVANPILTVILCLAKTGVAGLLAGLIYKAVSIKNIYIGVLCAAIICPVVNTGIFLAGMMLFYMDTLLLWAGGTHFFTYAVFTLTGVNFLLELVVNIVLTPAILRILNAVKKA